MTTSSKFNLAELATSIVRCFPSLNVVEQRLSLELYRLLADGQPVPRAALADRAGITVETVNRILDSWPGVFSDGAAANCRLLGSVPTSGLQQPSHAQNERPTSLRLVRLANFPPGYTKSRQSRVDSSTPYQSQRKPARICCRDRATLGSNPNSPWCKFGFVSRKC
jgi:alkylmercury lyase-like protein